MYKVTIESTGETFTTRADQLTATIGDKFYGDQLDILEELQEILEVDGLGWDHADALGIIVERA